MVTSTACLNPATSNCPLEFTNFIKFSEARLHAVSSRNMYSEQGLLALMRAVVLQVCQGVFWGVCPSVATASRRYGGSPRCANSFCALPVFRASRSPHFFYHHCLFSFAARL